MDEWMKVRQEVDPEGMFLGEWHKRNLPLLKHGDSIDDQLPLLEHEKERHILDTRVAGDGLEWVGAERWRGHGEENYRSSPEPTATSPTATSEESFDLLATGEASIVLPDTMLGV